MPCKSKKKLVSGLKKSATKAGLAPGSERFGAYVYGTEAKIEAAKKAKRKKK